MLILVAFYLLIIRPQRARAKAAQQLQDSLAPGVEVMTTAGLYGTLTEIRDDSVLLEVSPGVTCGSPRRPSAGSSPTTTADDDVDRRRRRRRDETAEARTTPRPSRRRTSAPSSTAGPTGRPDRTDREETLTWQQRARRAPDAPWRCSAS